MKRVLIITTHFAPDIHVGAKRMTKFSKYLPLYGWQPIILTKEVSEYHGVDETLLQELPPDLVIYRVREWRLPGSQTSSAQTMPGDAIQGKQTCAGLRNHLIKAAKFFLFYDYSWLLPAFLAARRLIRENDIRVIYSSSPNPDAHLVGLLLKALTGRPWVADFRDPWTALHIFYRPGRFKRAVDTLCEKAIVATADHITAISHTLALNLGKLRERRKKCSISVSYNGYDEEDFDEIDHNQFSARPFTITYLGTWGSGRSPEAFLRALGRLIVINPTLKDRIVVNFVGEVKFDAKMQEHIEQVISEENLDGVVKMIPFLPYRRGLDLLRNGDISLLVVSPFHSRVGCLSSKLFEYLHAGKPILALAPTESEEAQIVREANAGQVVTPDDVTAINRKIEEMYMAFQNGDFASNVNACAIEKFDRRRQTGELAAIFDGQIANLDKKYR